MPHQAPRAVRLRLVASISAALAAAVLSVAIAGPALATEPTASPMPTPVPTDSPAPSASAEPSVPATSPSATPSPTPSVSAKPTGRTLPKADVAPVVRGKVWYDERRNGLQDSWEEGVRGVTVLLWQKSATGAETSEATRTGYDGSYEFRDAKPGPARVEVIGTSVDFRTIYWEFSPANKGTNDAKDSDFTAAQTDGPNGKKIWVGHVRSLELKAGGTVTLDAGVFDPELPDVPRITVTGRVWHDNNRNGIRDAGEPGVKDIVVFAGHPGFFENRPAESPAKAVARARAKAKVDDDDAAHGIDFAMTAADGTYTIETVGPGLTQVAVFTQPYDARDESDPWHFTTFHVGGDRSKDSDVEATQREYELGKVTVGLSRTARIAKDKVFGVDAGLHQNETTPTATPVPAPGGGGSLPATGAALGGILAAGAALVGGGVALTVLTRRRRVRTIA